MMTTEEVGRVSSEIASGLARNPVILGAIVFNALVLGGLFYTVHQAAERSDERFKMAMNACMGQR